MKGLSPSEETDKERLVKRVTMDLTGLPPTLSEIDQFVEDDSEEAYELLVDRLLQSEAYAERMTQEWMDVARYSDSHGVSFDGYRTSWPYRDWLIQSFKSNIGYDKFISHQLAGDLIPDADQQSKIATSFLRMNPLEASAGSIPEEFRLEYVNERAGLTGTAILGLTVECAKCHDHKFDPISQKEFFQISAFYNTTVEYGLAPVDSDRPPTIIMIDDEKRSKIDSMLQQITDRQNRLKSILEDPPVSTFVALPSAIPADHVGYYPLNKIKPYSKEIKTKKKKKKKEFLDMQMLDGNKLAEANLKVTLVDGKAGSSAYFNEEFDFLTLQQMGEFEHSDPFSISTWINTEKEGNGSSQTIIGNVGNVFAYHRGWEMALDSFNHVRVRFIHRLPDDVFSLRTETPVSANEWHQIGFTYDGSKSNEGVSIFIDGISQKVISEVNKLKRSMLPIDEYTMKPDTVPLVVGKSNRLWMEDLGLFTGTIDEIKVYNRELSHWEMNLLGEADLDPESQELKLNHWFINDKNILPLKKEMQLLRKQIGTTLDTSIEVMVMEEMTNPRPTYLLKRGLYNQKGEEVQAGGIQKILPFADELPKNRLGLSQWLFDEKNPIVARVAINRYWQMIFGTGLVKTAEDFGSQGTRPTHPELLDWLAYDFIEHEWDLKYALKQMVMSHTYRQQSYCSPEIRKLDPENKYLSRSPSYRWPAEMIRDNALKASDLLVEEIGGPSVKPYQPEGLWKEVLMASGKLHKYKAESGDSLYRRSLYTFSRRFAPNPFMINFDVTPREICTIRRNITSTPLQALTLLNDPQFLEAARVLSQNLQLEYPQDVSKQIEIAYRKSTGLKPNKVQKEILDEHYMHSLNQFKEKPALIDSILSVGDYAFNEDLPKDQTAAMTLVISTIFNFDESYMKR